MCIRDRHWQYKKYILRSHKIWKNLPLSFEIRGELKKKAKFFKRLRLGKTTGWQHRFFDLTILSPIWLGTYEYMKSSRENFFFSVWNRASRVDFSDLVKNFQIWPSFCVHQKIIILSILGASKGYQAFRHYQSRCWKWKTPEKLKWPLWPAQTAQKKL